MAAGSPHVDPAVDVLRRLAGDVGPRGRGPPARRDGRRGRARTPSRRSASPAAWAPRPASSQRAHLESVIAHGTPPIKWLGRILLDPARERSPPGVATPATRPATARPRDGRRRRRSRRRSPDEIAPNRAAPREPGRCTTARRSATTTSWASCSSYRADDRSGAQLRRAMPRWSGRRVADAARHASASGMLGTGQMALAAALVRARRSVRCSAPTEATLQRRRLGAGHVRARRSGSATPRSCRTSTPRCASRPSSRASVDDHEALERLAFGIGHERAEDRRRRLAEALESGRLRAFVVRVDGEPAAVARLSQGDGVAGLTGIGVHPAWRRRGLGTLIDGRRDARRSGAGQPPRVAVGAGRRRGRLEPLREARLRPAFGWTRWLAVDPPED